MNLFSKFKQSNAKVSKRVLSENDKALSLTPSQLNQALDNFSPLLNPFTEKQLKRRLKVCVLWANKVGDRLRPKECFREFATLELGPNSNLPIFGVGTTSESEIVGMNDWMDNLHSNRRKELESDRPFVNDEKEKVDLAGGRLLVMEPASTIWDGVSSAETEYLLDVCDFPPIGLWVAFIDTPKIVNEDNVPYFRNDGYILSYIPPMFVDLVQAGMEVNAVDCIYWLDAQKHISGKIIQSWI